MQATDSLTHDYVHTNSVTLHVVQAGPQEGEPVLLLHGFPEFWYGWRHQIPFLASHGYRVWAPDQRGYNLSEKPRGIAAYNLDRLADDVAGLISQTGHDKVNLVGHDWGAAVAWWTALRHPRHLRRLVILNVPHPIVMQRYIRRHWRQLLKSWYIYFFQLPWLPERVLTEDGAEVSIEMLRGTSRAGSFTDEELEQYRRAFLRPRAMTSMINWYRATARTRTERLHSLQVTVPTLILWGYHDIALEWEMAKLSLEMCQNARLETFEEATHWVQHDEPHRVNQMILDFFAPGRTALNFAPAG